VEVTFDDKIFVFPVRAVWPVVRNFSFNCMLTASLAAPERAGVLTAEDTSFVEKSATGQFVLNFIEIIHLLSIILAAEIAKWRLGVAWL
jgi:hypothetical protein